MPWQQRGHTGMAVESWFMHGFGLCCWGRTLLLVPSMLLREDMGRVALLSFTTPYSVD